MSRSWRKDRRTVLWLVGAVAVLLLPATFPVASAAFTASTSDGGNAVTAGALAPPSGLSVTQTCTAAAPAFRSGSSATGVNSVSIATPAGVAAGDVLLAHVSNRETWSMATPGGWNLIRRDNSGPLQAGIYWRVATASEPAGVTFTLTGATNSQIVGGILAYSGANTTTPVNASGASTGNGQTATMPAVTTTSSNTVVVRVVAKRQEALPAPAGTTSRGSVLGTGASGLGAVAGDETFVGPGTTAARSSTSGTWFNSEWVGHTVALRPSAGTPSASLTWTASSTTAATGYRLERVVGGAVQATTTVTPVSSTSATDGPLVNGTAYTYRLSTYRGAWTSAAVTGVLTPSC